MGRRPAAGEDAGPAPMDTDGPQTTTRVAHGSQATPLTAPEPETAAGADAAGGGRPGQGAAARAGQQPAAGVKVTRKKFEHVKVRTTEKPVVVKPSLRTSWQKSHLPTSVRPRVWPA